jgi:hypothetical protein
MLYCYKMYDGQDKNNMSPHKSGGRHNDTSVNENETIKIYTNK